MSDDAIYVRSSACNLELFASDPGPSWVNVGSGSERRMVRRRDALADIYARQLVVRCDGDAVRLRALAAECRREARRSWSPREAWSTVRHRRSGPGQASWPAALSALTPWEMFAEYRVWRLSAALADAATKKVVQAGAEQDPSARARLVEATRHSTAFDVLGAMLPAEVEQAAAADLAERLHHIDTRPADSPDTPPPTGPDDEPGAPQR